MEYYICKSFIIDDNYYGLYKYLENFDDLNKIVSVHNNNLLHFVILNYADNNKKENLKLFNYLKTKIDINKKNTYGLSPNDIAFYYKREKLLDLSKQYLLISTDLMLITDTITIKNLYLVIKKINIHDIFFRSKIFSYIEWLLDCDFNKKNLKYTYKIVKNIIKNNIKLEILVNITVSVEDTNDKILLRKWKYILNNTDYYKRCKESFYDFESDILKKKESFNNKLLIFVIKKYNEIYKMLPKYNKSLFEMKNLVVYPEILKQHTKNCLLLFFHKYQFLDIKLTKTISNFIL